MPLFDGAPSQAGYLPAALILTIMVVPITSSICRELFSRVPRDLSDGALALGATKWETIRGVSIPTRAPVSSPPCCSAWAGHSARRSQSRR